MNTFSEHPKCKLCNAEAGLELDLTERAVAEKYGVHRKSVYRHRQHLIRESPQESSSDSFLERFNIPERTVTTRHVSAKDENGNWQKVAWKPNSSETEFPLWDYVTPAQPLNITIPAAPAAPVRGKYKLSLKCADTQIGFRILDSGEIESFHDDAAMSLFINAVLQEQPDSVVILGDFLDLPSQGKWSQEAAFARTTQMAINKGYEFLASIRAASPETEIVLVEGNHDKRLQTYVETNTIAAFGLKRADLPDSWPVMSLQNLLRLDELGVVYYDAYPAATHWDSDQVRNIHGTKANSKGSTTSQYVTEFPNISTWAGHSHRLEITYKTTLGARGEAIESYSANPGCLCKTDGTVPGVNSATHVDGSSARIVEDWQQGWGANYYSEDESWPFVYRIKDGKTVAGFAQSMSSK